MNNNFGYVSGVTWNKIIRCKTNSLQNFEIKKDSGNCGLAEEMEVFSNGYTFSIKSKRTPHYRLCNEYTLKNLDLDVEPSTWQVWDMKIILECLAEFGAEIKVIKE